MNYYLLFLVQSRLRTDRKRRMKIVSSGFAIKLHNYITGFYLLPPVSVVEVIETVPSACLCVSALMAQPLDLRTLNVVQGLTLIYLGQV